MTAWIDAAEVARNPTFDDRVISGDFATAKREDHVEQGSRGSMRRGILVSRLNISLAWCVNNARQLRIITRERKTPNEAES